MQLGRGMERCAIRGLAVALAIGGFASPVWSAPPVRINFCGNITSRGKIPPSGCFAFAIVNSAQTDTLWSNDGTSVSGGQPSACTEVTLGEDGEFCVLLGDTTQSNMVTIPATIFDSDDDRYLAVWFRDTSAGLNAEQLRPNSLLTYAPFAAASALARGSESVSAASVTSTGNVNVTSGNVTITSGNFVASSGGMTVSGGVSGDTGSFTTSMTTGAATVSGALTAGSATVTGALSAGSATVSGALSGTTASFSGAVSTGALSAASGTFTGGLSATTGAFSSAVTVGGNFTADTDTLFVDAANDRVGIGTTSPSVGLDVAKNVRVRTTATTGTGFLVDCSSISSGVCLDIDAQSSLASSGNAVRIKFDSTLGAQNVFLIRDVSGGGSNIFAVTGTGAISVASALSSSAAITSSSNISTSGSGAITSANGLTVSAGSVSLPAGTIDTAEIADSAVTTAKLNDSAVTTGKIADGTIANADVDAAAAIALSKLASGASAQVIVANGSGVPTYVAMSGDATIATSGALTIADSAVASAEITNDSIVSGDITDNTITATDLNATLTLADGDLLNLAAVNASGTAEGLILPQAADVSAATAEGQISWDTDGDALYVGTGAAATRVGSVVTITAGSGLANSGTAADPILDVNVGGGVEVNADTVRIAASAAGSGLTGGAGSALAVGAGTGITVNADDVAVSTGASFAWSGDHTWTLAETEDLAVDLSISGTNAGQGGIITLTNSSTAGNQYGLYLDNAASTGTTEAGLVIDNSDADTAVTAGIKFVDAGGGFTSVLDISGTLLSATELASLDGFSAATIGDITGVTAGSGLTDGGTSGTVTLNVGAGTGITVNADDVAVSTGSSFAWTGTHAWTFDAGEQLTVDASTTANTTTTGVVDLNVAAGDAAVDGVNIDITANDGITATTDVKGIELRLTANDADADLFGVTIFAAGTANAAAGSYEAAIKIDTTEDTSGAMTDAIIIAATNDGAITDAIDVSDTEITNAINIGANPIVTGNVAGTIGDGTTDSWTFTTDGTGTAEIQLPSGSIDSTEILDDEIVNADIDSAAAIAYSKLSLSNSIVSADITTDTITASDLNATLTFADGDYLDLSAILHDDTAVQGLKLPNVGAAPSDPTGTGEGFIGWDQTSNLLLVNDGTTWQSTGLFGAAIDGSEITNDTVVLTTDTAGDYVATLTAGGGLTGTVSGEGSTPTVAVGAGTGITVNADDVAVNQGFTPTWSGAHTFQTDVDLSYAGSENLTIANSSATADQLVLTTTVSDNNSADAIEITITDNTATSGTGQGIVIKTGDGSASLDAALAIDHTDTTQAMTKGIAITGAASTAVTTAIDVSDAEIGDAINVGANPIITGNAAGTIGDSTTDSWTFTTDGTGTAEIQLPSGSIDSTEILDDEIVNADIDSAAAIAYSKLSLSNSIVSADITTDTITASDLNATLTFADGDYLDLSAILHDDTAVQGLKLPNVGAAPSDPTGTGEGFIGWDQTSNLLLVNDGTTWQSMGLFGAAIDGSEITNDTVVLTTDTAGDYVATLTAGGGLTGTVSGEGSTPTVAVGAGTGITVNADDVAINQTFTPTWTGAHTFQTDVDFTFSAAENLAISSTSADTVDAMAVAVTVSDDADATDEIVGQSFDITNSSGDAGDLVGGVLITANDAGTGVVDYGLSIINEQATDIDLTDGIVISAVTNASIDDAIDVSDAEITNAINIGANPIVTGNVAGTIGDSTTDSWTFTTDGTGDAEIQLPTGSIGTTEVLDDTLTASDLNATITFADADLIDLSAINASGTGEGLKLPQATDVSAATAEGQLSWDSDNDTLYVGTGAAALAIGTGDITGVTAGSGLTGTAASGEATLSLSALTADWDQTGAYDIVLNNASSELKILESVGATYYGIIDVGNLSANTTLTIGSVSGTIITTGDTGTVTSAIIGADAVGSSEIQDGQVGDSELASNSVTTGKIADNEVSASDLSATLTFADGDLVNLASINASGTAEGLKLPQATDVSAATAEGQISWDTDNDILYVGTGSAVSATVTTASTPTWTGAHTFTFSAAENLAISSTSADTVDAVSLTLTASDDADDTDEIVGQTFDITNNSGDANDIVGGVLITANDAGTGVVDYGLSIINEQATDIDLTDGIVISAVTDASIVDGIDVSDAEITNAINIGANPIVGSTITLGDTGQNPAVVPASASAQDLGSTSAEWDDIFVGDNNGLNLGLDQDAELAYDETTDDRVELTGTGASLYIEDRLALGRQTLTMVAAGNQTETLTPTASYVEVTGQDHVSDDISVSTTGAKEGALLIVTNLDATTVAIKWEATTKLDGGASVTLSQYDVIMLIFDGTNWLQVAKVAANS